MIKLLEILIIKKLKTNNDDIISIDSNDNKLSYY